MDKMRIEIWSDIACPFCYIGKRKLEKALDSSQLRDKVELIWYSYELNPKLPKEPNPLSFYEYLAQIHEETIDQAKENTKTLLKTAEEVGLVYNLDKLIITNTSDALRLIKLAKKHNLASEAEEVLFKAYFTDGKCISNSNVLVQLGTDIGLKPEEITNMLTSDLFKDKIDSDKQRAEEQFNLEYIPFYRINFKHTIQGAIAIDDYIKVLQTAFQEWNSGDESSSLDLKGQSCSIDGVCS